MPGIAEGIYAQYVDSVIKMAKTTGGVSRPQIMEKLNVKRPEANALIGEAKLRRARTVGRTDFFVASKATKNVHNTSEDSDVNQQSSASTGSSSNVGEGQNQPTNRLPEEDKTMVQTVQAPAPVVSDTDRVAASEKKIKLLKQGIADALEKAKQAEQVRLTQQAHAGALGSALENALKERLAL